MRMRKIEYQWNKDGNMLDNDLKNGEKKKEELEDITNKINNFMMSYDDNQQGEMNQKDNVNND